MLFENGQPKNTFDVVMHFFVLEHVRDPLAFIQQNLKLLQKGGRLIIEIPNAADPLHTVYKIPAFERFYWSLPHHWYFSEKSLGYLLDKVGVTYKILRDQRYDFSNHMTWTLTGRPGGMSKFTQLLGQELEDVYRTQLVKKGFCDTLIAVLSKES
jgi:SAM-dependent methyltransferase